MSWFYDGVDLLRKAYANTGVEEGIEESLALLVSEEAVGDWLAAAVKLVTCGDLATAITDWLNPAPVVEEPIAAEAAKETKVSIAQKARQIVRKVRGPTLEEKVAYFRTHEVTIGALARHIMRLHPDGVKGHGHVPGHRIEFHLVKVNEETGEVVIDHRWSYAGCYPHKWTAMKGLTVRLIPA